MRIVYACFERIVPGSAAATHVEEIRRGLERRGVEVALCAETGQRRGGVLAQALRYLRVGAATARRAARADAIYMRAHFAGFPVALLAKLLGKPVLQEINGVYAEAFVTHPRFARLKKPLTWMQRQQYRWASALIAVTPGLTEWGKAEAGHGRATHIGNGANTELFRPDGPRYEHPRPYAFFFGGITRWHGVPVLLEAVGSSSWPENCDVLIAGPVVDESLRPLMENLPPRVAWLGRVAQADLPALIRGAAAALVPAHDPKGVASHGITPLKLFEMLACGAPVVASDYPGLADIVRGGDCGVVVPPGDPEALARGVAEVIGDPERARAMGERGARLAAEEHSWDARAAETLEVIRGVLAESPGRRRV